MGDLILVGVAYAAGVLFTLYLVLEAITRGDREGTDIRAMMAEDHLTEASCVLVIVIYVLGWPLVALALLGISLLRAIAALIPS